MGQNRHGTSKVIGKSHVVVDAQVLVDGGPEIIWGKGALDGFLAF